MGRGRPRAIRPMKKLLIAIALGEAASGLALLTVPSL
jgi:hypothetical protein